ncbi:MAG: Ni/Fe hydrogenase [Candidatus Parabeggiatoa sp. nov. 1]|nr:MAG: Ni/Fe hydrogenase [Gammaproteobacteria bacterium]
MSKHQTIAERLHSQGFSRRDFLKFCGMTATIMGLPPAIIPQIAKALEKTPRQSVIWLSFQECTGCTESLTRAHTPTIEGLIFDHISLDYHLTLQAAAGKAAELTRQQAMQDNKGNYLLIVDGSIPVGNPGYSTIAGRSNKDMLMEVAEGAKAILAVGSCAAFGGIPHAYPNPTGAVPVEELITDKPIINLPGCPPIPVAIAGVIAQIVTFGTLPELDSLKRPLSFYGQNIHDRCYRRPFYDKGLFAESFDDEGAKKGWCLYKLGCKGPVTYNACATTKWNAGVSFPIESGHGCLGCSEPNFWDAGSFYKALSVPTGDFAQTAGYALAAGAAVGVASGILNKMKKRDAIGNHETVTIDDLERK